MPIECDWCGKRYAHRSGFHYHLNRKPAEITIVDTRYRREYTFVTCQVRDPRWLTQDAGPAFRTSRWRRYADDYSRTARSRSTRCSKPARGIFSTKRRSGNYASNRVPKFAFCTYVHIVSSPLDRSVIKLLAVCGNEPAFNMF